MAQLALHVLGSPSITLDDIPVILEQRKALALLAYLALTAHPQQRAALATLLWPELQPVKALANLRQTLWLLRSTGLGGWLALDRQTVALRDGY